MDSMGFDRPDLLIEPRELAQALAAFFPAELAGECASEAPSGKRFSSPPIIVDTRPAEAFAAGHIPGAIHLDLWGFSLIDTDEAPRRAFLWMIHHVLEQRGINADRSVVVYDDTTGMRAARVFWFLEYFGHPAACVLDGGSSAWLAARLPVSRDALVPKPVRWPVKPVEYLAASRHDVALRLASPDAVILDTRSDDEYTGRIARAARGGAIPGAVHVEWKRNLAEDGTLRSASELRRMYSEAGVTPDKEVISYCQGGYRAAHAYLALPLLGYPQVRNYLGSWKEWGDREELPTEVKGN